MVDRRWGIAVLLGLLGLLVLVIVPQADLEPVPRAPAEPVLGEALVPPVSTPGPSGPIRCPVTMAVPVEGRVEFWLSLHHNGPGTRVVGVSAQLRDGVALIDEPGYPSSLRFGKLVVPGYVPAHVAWTATGSCPEVELRQAGVVRGTVQPAPQDGPPGRVEVDGCGRGAAVHEDGTFYLEVDPVRCALRATRQDGWYATRSEPVWIEPSPDREVEVALFLPEAEQGGLGATLVEDESGMRLSAIRRGSTADLAGLRPGDILVAVEGEDPSEMAAADIGALTIGDAHTELVLEVLVDGERKTLALPRLPVPSLDDHDESDGWVDGIEP